MSNPVSAIPPASASLAEEHFSRKLSLETDCWDVHESMLRGQQDFVLLDVRGDAAYQSAHVPGAVSLPHGKITERKMSEWPAETLFVVYCAGPHCNGADRGALRLASLGRPVKMMIGGMTGWADEGFAFAHGPESGSVVQESEKPSPSVLAEE